MCDDVASFLQLPGAFRRVCAPRIEPIDPPTTNLQNYVRRTRVTTSRPAIRHEGTPVALAVLRVGADSVTVAALARGAPRTIDLAFVPVGGGGSSTSSSTSSSTLLSLLPTTTPGLLLGALPADSLRPNTQYQFTVSAFFQYGVETPRMYAPRDVRGHPVVYRLWTHGAPTVTSVVGRMVQVVSPPFNARRPAWYERCSGPGSGGGVVAADLGRGPQSESLQVFVVFASSAEGAATQTVPLSGGVAFAPSSLPAGVVYDASYALAVYAFHGEGEVDEYASDYFSVTF